MKSSKNVRIIACFRKDVIKFTMKLKFSMQNNISPIPCGRFCFYGFNSHEFLVHANKQKKNV